MNQTILNALSKPPVYTKTEGEFWNDEYISKQMLAAHLDPDFEGASRKLDFITKSVEWITSLVPPDQYPTLLDVGCGPGIYAEKFTKSGYQVTGVDFSKRSIEYAKQSASKNHEDIQYLFQNYLTMDLKKQFDFATLIYCDYGALSTEDRKQVLKKIYEHLKPGGKLLFDVFSMKKYQEFEEEQTWNISKEGGFWQASEYLELNGTYRYPDDVTLKLTTVISNEENKTYYLWDTYYTKESLAEEATQAGFQVCEIFGDVAGSSYSENSDTIAILLER